MTISTSRPLLLFSAFSFALLVTACQTKEVALPEIYKGALNEGENIETHYIEKNALKLKMKAKKILQMQNGDQDFPEGIYLEFYDGLGNITSTLQANQAYQFKEENKWRGRGNVIIKNIEKNQQLNTEELFWKPNTKKIYTDKFVTITTEDETIMGYGMEALQDLSDYKILNTKGVLNADE